MRIVIGIIALAFLVGCKNGSKSTETETGCDQLLVVTPDVQVEVDEGIKVTKLYLKSDCLNVRVKYANCGDAGFDLVHNGRVKKSLPPQVDLVLKAKGKPCDVAQEAEKEFSFDISKLQSISDDGKVVIRVHRYSEAVVYEY